jgi:DNA-directed RNA polymerase specialized sigma subunit
LWPSYPISSGSSELTGPEESENDGTVLTSDFQEAIAELCEKGSSGPTIANISKWLAGGKEENLKIMTYEEEINNVLEDDNSENEHESSTPPIIHTIRQDEAISNFNKCYKWAKENNVHSEHILTWKRLQETVLKEAFGNKSHKIIDTFFVKMQ